MGTLLFGEGQCGLGLDRMRDRVSLRVACETQDVPDFASNVAQKRLRRRSARSERGNGLSRALGARVDSLLLLVFLLFFTVDATRVAELLHQVAHDELVLGIAVGGASQVIADGHAVRPLLQVVV